MGQTSAIDRYWSTFFGVDPSALRGERVKIVPHAQLGAWTGGWFFCLRGAGCIVSAPPEWRRRIEAEASRIRTLDDVDLPLLDRVFGERRSGVVGPAYHGYLAPDRFREHERADVRKLTPHDLLAVRALRDACDATDWDHAGLDADSCDVVGCLQQGELVSMAGMRVGAHDSCDPGVVTRPDARGRGHGLACTSASVASALEAGRLVRYQTLHANTPAMEIARRLGFAHYASHLAVRLE